MNSTKHLLLPLALFLFLGCNSSATSDVNVTTGGDEETAPSDRDAATPAGDVELSILTFDEINELVASKRGKVVVMDAWSTACPPCLKDFHNLVELHEQYGPEELAAVSLSFDYEGIGKPEDVEEPVLRFLRGQGAAFDNVMSSEESDVLYRKFELNAVPAIFVYDRAGKLRERFEDEGAYEKVRPLVAELVKEPAPEEPAQQ